MASTITIGAQVRKKSGGAVMTVVKVEHKQCLCTFNKKQEPPYFTPTAVKSLWFKQDDLVLVKAAPKKVVKKPLKKK